MTIVKTNYRCCHWLLRKANTINFNCSTHGNVQAPKPERQIVKNEIAKKRKTTNYALQNFGLKTKKIVLQRTNRLTVNLNTDLDSW